MWDARNSAVHGINSSTRQSACRRKIAVKLRHLHAQRDKILCTDASIFIGDTSKDLETYIENTQRPSHRKLASHLETSHHRQR
jgi:hypothetical protein